MCGITGYVNFVSIDKNHCDVIAEMVASLKHRGPNNQSFDVEENLDYDIALGHARLSIIDLSDKANQPMRYKNFSIVYNGEIYNFEEIKKELCSLGHTFNLHSDTEVILHAFEEWTEKCLDKFVGMFSIVIYDKELKRVFIARDRAGVKPFYYSMNENRFIFGSEIKSFYPHPLFKAVLDQKSIGLYFKHGNIPSPYTIYKDINKLPSGHYGFIDIEKKSFERHSYWDIYSLYEYDKEFKLSYKEALEQTHEALVKAVLYRNVSDVETGVFLSGGYDSATVAAIMQKHSSKTINTFTIGFEQGNNEAPYAKEIAKFLGTNHHEYYLTAEKAGEIINTLPYYFDEPFADSSAIPTIFVSSKAGESVKVVISADGGDELFFGYDNYNIIENYADKLKKIPDCNGVKSLLKYGSQLVSNLYPKYSFKNRKLNFFKEIAIEDIHYRESIMFGLYGATHSNLLSKILKRVENVPSIYRKDKAKFKDTMSMVLALDYNISLQNDMLTKVDRATMSQSVEGREPFMDHNLLKLVASLPTSFKYNQGVKKRILKDLLHTYIPKDMMNRPKLGFTVPIYDWLRTDLAYLINDYLSYESLSESLIFNVNYVIHLKELFFKKKLPDETMIWKILMFQMWFAKWKSHINLKD